ncbi:MAG TPA: tRNA uridine-5-carboxymethylaminomethyl(34) synthesis GTPase MnmE [Pyrinomonadaceae bacterium]|nr:tRNA uridine-5-carboxymethylaminomethyl(34) synthesis GTPase MnmE [Pyrinomonadaceae bacterium]
MSTIVALATPLGRSGIGVVRLSGRDALEISRTMIEEQMFNPVPRTASLRQLYDPEDREAIDEAVLTYFKAPNSFTGEDIVEISCHGSPVLLRRVIDICLSNGARLAGPGEFTLRALSNGRIDLSEAEAIRDLIDSQTIASARQAVRQMRGEFSHQLQPKKDELLDAIVVLESALEFVEDDLPELQLAEVADRLTSIATEIGKIADTFSAGKLLRDGLRVVLVGRPNVGKSSLFNAMLGSERAIVTEVPGTTRDQINERFIVNDVPVSLMDTAGLRETADVVESIGVERSRSAMADADLVIVVLDISEQLNEEDVEILRSVSDLPHIIAVNKLDKVSQPQSGTYISNLGNNLEKNETEFLAVSASELTGVEDLKKAIVGRFARNDVSDAGFLVTDARHFDLLVRAKNEIEGSVTLIQERASEEIVLVGLHNSLRFLGQITGETTTEDMLGRIFSTFCIGK